MPPQHLRQPLDERSEDRSVCPVQAGLGVGSAQHGDFMTQHQESDTPPSPENRKVGASTPPLVTAPEL
jgi:hypothetical protein